MGLTISKWKSDRPTDRPTGTIRSGADKWCCYTCSLWHSELTGQGLYNETALEINCSSSSSFSVVFVGPVTRSDKDSRDCTPSSPNAHFFGRSTGTTAGATTSSNGGINRLVVSSSGSDEGPVPGSNHNQDAVDREEMIAKEKTIDAYVNFKR